MRTRERNSNKMSRRSTREIIIIKKKNKRNKTQRMGKKKSKERND